jgi:phage-related protein
VNPKNPNEKPLFIFNGVELGTPPMNAAARREAGFLLGLLQSGEVLGMPQARPLFDIAPRLYELRVREAGRNWRIFYRADADRVLVIHQINKTTPTLTEQDKDTVINRLAAYDAAQEKNRAKEPK